MTPGQGESSTKVEEAVAEVTRKEQELMEAKRKRATEFQAAGWVHVTGLPAYRPDDRGEYIIQCRACDLGHHCGNNGILVAYTTDGEVWIAHHAVTEKEEKPYLKFASASGAFVPCSNGERIPQSLLLERIADPYCTAGRHYSATPQVDRALPKPAGQE